MATIKKLLKAGLVGKRNSVPTNSAIKNSQKATTYVGKGVLKNGGGITPVPNGPLIKKKGEFKGSTLKSGGKVKLSAGGEKHVVYKKDSPTGIGKGKKGHIMVNHPTKDKGEWDTIDLTEKSGAKTVKQGVASTKKWHKDHPYKMKNGGSTPAWTRSEGKDPKGGLNRKGIASYRRENPGSKLSMAVTTKPSKLKPGSKSANRRKSFCSRMSGVSGPMKKPNGKPTRKALALRKWNC